MKMSIDRITICGNIHGDLEGFLKDCLAMEGRSMAKYPYRDTIYFQDGSVLQIAEKSASNPSFYVPKKGEEMEEMKTRKSSAIKELRYDFNPNNTSHEKLHMQVIGLMYDVHLTRVDVAFDVHDVDMKRWRWIDSKGRPYNVYYSGSGEVETWYVGGKESEVKIRIYDKAKEQKIKDKVWWRVEVQLRRDSAKLLGVHKGDIDINPFEYVTPVVNGNFPELDIKTRAMVKYLIDNPSGFSELSRPSRTEYKKTIRMIGSWECIDFYHIWQKKYSLVASELGSWLSLAK